MLDLRVARLLAPVVLGGCLLKEQPPPVTDVHLDPSRVDLTLDSGGAPLSVTVSIVNAGIGEAEIVELALIGDNAFRVELATDGTLPVTLAPQARLDVVLTLADLPLQSEPFYEELELWAS